ANFDPFRGQIVGQDAGVVRDLRAAGAIILGKTVTTQLASAPDGVQTRNPWNRAHTPGGSSSGSAAAVAARQVPAAIGHQSGGSVLRPAAYCGVVGLKPTFGRLSHYGLLPGAWTLDHPGVIVRSVADAALLLQALARHDPRDPYSAMQPSEDFVAAAREPIVPRLGLLRDLLDRAQPSVRRATEDAAQRLARVGAEVREVRLPAPMELLLAVHRIIRIGEAAAAHAEVHARWADHYRPSVRALIEVGQLLPAAALVQAARLRRRLGTLLAAWAGEVDALVGPTASNPPPLAEAGTGDPSFQAPWTLLGFPNITLPISIGADGLPHGAQLIARPWAERRLLRIAAWCEGVLGPLPAPP
ncbi:MAG: amidase, partial [Chloroflexi bacterium]|nr:amidase [Chloroflexota bacterium]